MAEEEIFKVFQSQQIENSTNSSHIFKYIEM